MGAKTCMLAYVSGNAPQILRSLPELNRQASTELARKLFPAEKLEQIDDGDLSFASPPDDEVYVGCFPGISIVAAADVALDYPSKLPADYLKAVDCETLLLHAMQSVVDWFAFAVWRKGRLVRSLSLSPDDGILEDIGPRLAFEEAYWAGQHPAIDPEEEDEEESDYPFPFHPLDLGEAALLDLFGYQLEGIVDDALLQPEQIPLLAFKRKKTKWKLW